MSCHGSQFSVIFPSLLVWLRICHVFVVFSSICCHIFSLVPEVGLIWPTFVVVFPNLLLCFWIFCHFSKCIVTLLNLQIFEFAITFSNVLSWICCLFFHLSLMPPSRICCQISWTCLYIFKFSVTCMCWYTESSGTSIVLEMKKLCGLMCQSCACFFYCFFCFVFY